MTLLRPTVLLAIGIGALAGRETAAGRSYGSEYYRSPVGFAITLAGNVGEIRSNHFHTGLDIKALQGVGSPIYATADGYVSRIGVSPTGYGHVLYVTHPNGETSVYGHLNGFAPQIARWVRERQYEKRSFRVDLYPDKGQFPVKQGERIAFLGNTGSSGGPHLHFEIRDAQGRPRNLVAEGVFRVGDRVPPVVSRILVYDLYSSNGMSYYRVLRQSIAVRTLADGTAIPEDTVLRFGKQGYLAYEVIDYKDGKSNTMGIYALEQRVDGVPNFGFAIDRIDFGTNAYVNAFVDFAENRRARRTSVLRAYVSPHNRLSVYRPALAAGGDGVISMDEQVESRRVETIFTDDAGNRTTLKFRLERGSDLCVPLPRGEAVNWTLGRTFRLPGAEVSIPGGALYESMILPAERDTICGRAVVRVGNEDVPLQKAATVALAADTLPERLRSKMLVVTVDDEGRICSAGGRWDGGSKRVATSVKRLGCFSVAVDTLPPVIRAGAASGTQIPAGKTVRWTATDDLSGVVYSALTVDGEWELLAWDPKSRTLEHTPTRGATAKRHSLSLTVSDAKGNTKTWKGTYIW